ncbi:MAG: chemotaxis protein CheB, partial [Balneolaceae bacterium]
MGKIKAYIVDNNVLNRHMITNTIKKEGDILAVLSSNCENQRSIISEIGNINPNVVLIGINSAESKNFQLFRSVRQKFKSLPVIVLIPKNPEGAIAGIQALKEGAVEIITLPENSSTILLAKDHLKKRLISFISSIPNINVDLLSGDKSKTDYQINPKLTVNRSVNPVDLVIIAGCTGGIRSLFSLIKELPSDLSVPVLVVQHLPYNFTGQLAEELNKISKLRVDEADHGDLIVPGRVLIAPGGYHINIKNDGTDETIALHRGPREQKCRPSIDVLIRSARYVYGGNLLTVFLS